MQMQSDGTAAGETPPRVTGRKIFHPKLTGWSRTETRFVFHPKFTCRWMVTQRQHLSSVTDDIPEVRCLFYKQVTVTLVIRIIRNDMIYYKTDDGSQLPIEKVKAINQKVTAAVV